MLSVSKTYQDQLIAERLSSNPPVANTYAPGDLILKRTEKMTRPDKLTPVYLGPFEVISHTKNDIVAKHLHRNESVVLQSEQVKPFFGTRDEASDAALLDRDERKFDCIINWKGDPQRRTHCDFRVKWTDGTYSWEQWKRENISDTLQYEEYINRTPELMPLRSETAKEYALKRTALRKQAVSVSVNDILYVDFRTWNTDFENPWFDRLNLPDSDDVQYVCLCKVTRVLASAKSAVRNKAEIVFPLFGKAVTVVQEDWIQTWGQNTEIPAGAVFVDKAFGEAYPQIYQQVI